MVSTPASSWKVRDAVRTLLLYPVVLGLGLVAGYAELKRPALVKGLVLLPALLAAFAVSVGTLFGAWLFAAALVQGPSGAGQSGHVFFKYLYLVPPLIL